MQKRQKLVSMHPLVWVTLLLLMTVSTQAARPLWTFTPRTAVEFTIRKGDTAEVIYTVQNQSFSPKNLVLRPVPGITQNSTCNLPGKGSTCTLRLGINSTALTGDVLGGPVLCQGGNPNQCYQPCPNEILRIHLAPPIPPPPQRKFTVTPIAGANGTISPATQQVVNAGSSLTFTATPNTGFVVDQWFVDGAVVQTGGTSFQLSNIQANHTVRVTFQQEAMFTVGGRVFGLQGRLVLQNNGGDFLGLNADGSFTFSNALPSGSAYSVTVLRKPFDQTCTVINGSGTITDENVSNVFVFCSDNSRTVGGTLTGLAASESVTLQNNGGDNLIRTADGSFTFPTPVAQGAPYNVTILNQPSTQTCTVSNGSGTAHLSDITNVQVTCSTNTFTVGGTVSGLAASGSVVLQNNAGDNITVNANGSFTFPTPVAQGAPYDVTVLTQPTAQTCTVTNGSGTIGGANVTDVQVDCVLHETTLSASVTDLALSVTGFTEYGVSGTPSSGLARVITITNTGEETATNLVVTHPTWPSGTMSSTNCLATLPPDPPDNSCTITVTPGNTPTSDGTDPCSSGTSPQPGVVQVTADNANAVSTNVVVLSYGCVYQGGYVFALDDTPLNNTSIGGKVAATSDQSPAILWGPAVEVGGISETSTAGTNSCNGATDGQCNTTRIISANLNPPPAAQLCEDLSSGGFNNWYLPAVCELSYAAGAFDFCGPAATPVLQNMQFSLIDFNNLNLLEGFYWSSTEYSNNPENFAFFEKFNFYQDVDIKTSFILQVRCVRAF